MTSTSVPRLRVKLPPPPTPPPRLSQMHQQPSVLILIGSVVVTHRLLSNSPPPTTAEGTHSSQLQTIQTHAPRSCTNTTGCSSKWPCACMLRSPRARTTVQGCDRAHWIQIENNKCSSGWLTDSHYIATLGVLQHPFSLPCEAFQCVLVKGKQALIKPWQQ